jgi:hypothetical protein
MTVPVVEDWLSGTSSPPYRFFTHLAVALSGQEPWQLDRKAVFEPIAFYNYVKKVMPRARVSPEKVDFEESEGAFREIVEQLKPTHIAVCGNRLWVNLPAFDSPDTNGASAVLGDKEFEIGRYRTASAAPLAMCIRHPQSGFNGRDWHPRIQAFLAID